MYIFLNVLIYALCVFADESEERRSKLPYIADAVGNKIPRPSSVPATVGSPVNLLTPDRYEFYTFDESGELVKRLMTLEEIQAIVAAGEDTDGLVTFANDDQPTIAFNFSQPSYTKVHNVVTNVQNVLKAQMEAHKNNPHMQPTFDTPDVSDSWSLILPSIFGNTGVDIAPDKSSSSFITPETDTIEIDNSDDYLYPFSKEANNRPQSTISTESIDENKQTSNKHDTSKTTSAVTEKSTASPSKVSVSTKSPYTSSIITTEKYKFSTSTNKPRPSVSSTTKVFTNKYSTKANIETTTTLIDNKSVSSTPNIIQNNKNKTNVESTTQATGEINNKHDDVFIPVSTVSYITESTKRPTKISTVKPISTTLHANIATNALASGASAEILSDINKSQPTSEPSMISSSKHPENDHNNSTTITTQSVSPSTTMSSTELISASNDGLENVNKLDDPILPLFDVAQSISQIASDLGGNFEPLPTTSNMLDTTKNGNMDIESKENIEIEIPQEIEKENSTISDNYVKVSMFEPNNKTEQSVVKTSEETSTIKINEDEVTTILTTLTSIELTTTADLIETTTMDPILSESMGDLLSQVVHENNDIKISETDDREKENNVEEKGVTIPSKDNSEFDLTTTEIPIETVMTSTEANYKNETNENEIKNSSMIDKEVTSTTERINKSDDSPSFVPISSFTYNIQQNNITGSDPQNVSEHKYMITKIVTKPNFASSNALKQSINSESNLSPQQNKDKNSASFIKKNPITTIINKNAASIENKVSHSDANKVENKLNKVSDVPKIDEFKKKIQKINIDDKELANERNNSWKLIPTVPPPKNHGDIGNKYKPEGFYTPENSVDKDIVLDFSKENQGLEVTTKDLGEDISEFVVLCNELAFQYWDDISANLEKKRSFVFSPYAITSILAMMFMGARGGTSGEMNEILKLDDMVTFNPHFTLKNISDSIEISPASGVAVSAFIRELYSDRSKGKILTFYKERAQQFYNGHVEEVNFKLINDIIRRRTNLLVKRYTYGKIIEFMKTNSIVMKPPLAAFSTNIFETDCSGSTVDGRDGEMYFVVSPNIRQRRLVPVPAVVYRSNFLAGYDPVLDATAAALGNTNSVISTLFLMPGQQGNIVHADDLEALENRLLNSNPSTPTWNRLLRTLLPRVGLELQIPRFSHKSIFNISSSLKKMGLNELFDPEHADLGGVNGPAKNLFLSDMIQLNSFVTCGESMIGDQHHVEEYPETLELVEKVQKRRSSRWLNWDEPRDYQRAFHDPHDVGEAMHLPLHLRPRQARLPARNAQPARLKFDRPFLYFVRHNPSGMILYVGRYNPRLLP